jgi:hypothetical protein
MPFASENDLPDHQEKEGNLDHAMVDVNILYTDQMH